jgi:predicted nucleotidyltransferase
MAKSTTKPSKTIIHTRSVGRILRASSKTSITKKQFADLKLKVVPVLRPYASRISVFGSYARGEATSTSDIDLLIALRPANARPSLGLFKFVGLEKTLEKKLGREVDLITEDEVNMRRRQSIEKDRVVLYEARQR